METEEQHQKELEILRSYERENLINDILIVINNDRIPESCFGCQFRLFDYYCDLLTIDLLANISKCTIYDWTKYLLEEL